MKEKSGKMMDKLSGLVIAAKEMRNKAYCPYSKYRVGSALLTQDGQVFTGCNIENSSYGMTICAERVALFNWKSSGCPSQPIILVNVADCDDHYSPCGGCLQVMLEFMYGDATVVHYNIRLEKEFKNKDLDYQPRMWGLKELIPFANPKIV